MKFIKKIPEEYYKLTTLYFRSLSTREKYKVVGLIEDKSNKENGKNLLLECLDGYGYSLTQIKAKINKYNFDIIFFDFDKDKKYIYYSYDYFYKYFKEIYKYEV